MERKHLHKINNKKKNNNPRHIPLIILFIESASDTLFVQIDKERKLI